MEDLRYIYSVARVKVLETRLLKKEIFLNLLQAQRLDTALRILTENPSYAGDIIQDSGDIDTFMNLEKQKLERQAQELFMDSFLFKALLYLRKDLLQSYALIMQTRSQFLKDFIRRFVDLYNIKTFLRMRYQRSPLENLKINLVEGGYIPKTSFINLFSQGKIDFYTEIIKEGIAKIEKEGDFSILEREMEDYLIRLLKPAKHMFFGPEAIFGYCLAKENELKMLGLILLGKINNISPQQIQERITSTYV
jgi:V/A-type H+-transporting ATPase subunit C